MRTNSLLNAATAVSSISAHYKEHQTHGKGCGTWPQFKARRLLLNVIKLLLASKQGRILFEGGLFLREYGTLHLTLQVVTQNVFAIKMYSSKKVFCCLAEISL